MSALGVVGRIIVRVATHKYVRAAGRAALRAAAAELIRHAQHHLRYRTHMSEGIR